MWYYELEYYGKHFSEPEKCQREVLGCLGVHMYINLVIMYFTSLKKANQQNANVTFQAVLDVHRT